MSDPSVNGAPEVDVDAMLDDGFDDQLAVELRGKIAQIDGQLAGLQKLVERKRKYEGLLNRLTGGYKKPGPTGPRGPDGSRVRAVPAGIGAERVAEIKQMILDYAADHEEFRQVDVRTLPTPSGWRFTSSISANAFEQLRQENFLRIGRVNGNQKFYRLTREALAAQK
jgi:hypothetical protein